MPVSLLGRHRPRRAAEQSWRRHGRRVSRRALLIVGLAVLGGPLAYIVLPVPVAAEPGAVGVFAASSAVSAAPAAAAAPAALVGGVIAGDDLLSNPMGVVSTGVELLAGGPLIGWPVSDHTPSTGFGYRSDPFTHRQRWHDGVDLGQPCGDEILASVAGTVTHAGWAGGYGNRVIIKHADRDGHSFATTYSHLSKIEVSVGQQISQRFVVGRVGSTGRSTACHLHFEVILDGSYVDPMRFLTGDTSKAGLSRRVGSFMPEGLPSPMSTPSPTVTRTPSRTPSATASPSPSPPVTPSPTSPSPTSPSPSSPSPSSPSPVSPSPTTPSGSATTPGPSTTLRSQTPVSPTPVSPTPVSPSPAAQSPTLPAAPTAQTPADAAGSPG
ncbi:MAG: M23 family metallopeptidase [Propionibacteriaceae bacterium]|nr:M23 family metallopeptidase [Propionibacteriaceae bacterium]